MAEDIKLPDMGEGVESATVAGVLVKVGDDVDVDQGIVELETDKAVAEVPCPKAGKVKEIHVQPDQEVTPGDLLLTLETADEETEGTEKKEKPGHAEKKKAKGRKPGKKAAKSKAGAEAEEEPEEAEEEAEVEEEEAAEAEGPEAAPAEEKARTAEAEAPARRQRGAGAASDIPAAPSVRRLARELGVDLASVSGSGDGGWITEADVKAAAKKAAARPPAAEGEGERDPWGPVRREKMRQIRRAIARKMQESHGHAVHVTHFADADVTELMDFRKRHKSDFAAEGIELGLLPFVVRGVVDALKTHPVVNASLDMDEGTIIYKDYISIGIAVDTDRGLVVPVIRNAGCLSVAETAKAIEEITARARGDDFDVADLRGGTFTVSNLGSIGGKYATPVINYPESAILLIGRAGPKPVARDGQVVVRTILPLSLSYDHRIIDGAEAGRFLNDVISFLEDPARLLTR